VSETVRGLVVPGAKLVELADGFRFTEGPAADADGNVFFSDLLTSRIYKWSVDGQLTDFRKNSGGANGLFFDRDGTMVICEGDNGRLTAIDPKGNVTVLAYQYNNIRFNKPNDLWIDPKGGVYFSDPAYQARVVQDGEHVYYLTPDRDRVIRVIDDMTRPNGIIGLPSGKMLYVTDHGAGKAFRYDINSDGTLYNKTLFAPIGSDGMTIDNMGNIYLTENGVLIYDPAGNRIDEIKIPVQPTNVCFGGKDGKTLFVTARTSFYSIRMHVKGVSCFTKSTGHSADIKVPGDMLLIPGGSFEMGDHHGLGGREHRNDEVPVHTIHVDSFYIGKCEVTNLQYCNFLNSALSHSLIEVRNGFVFAPGGGKIYCETRKAVPYGRIAWDGSRFTVLDSKEEHPMIGVRWLGAAAYCNWLSSRYGYQELYELSTGVCDFTGKGFRLPTEAEWEFAGRGGSYSPYFLYPWGDDADYSKANWPGSKDPYETGPYPWTTPVGFYNGQLHRKADFGWPAWHKSYQTSDGSNGYGLYDMAGNVWEWCGDWYSREYYGQSPYFNPLGPGKGSPVQDGNTYHVLRSGNWYNGPEGHSRVSNRNPAYYRGPKDPNHEYYHIGFRVVLDIQGGDRQSGGRAQIKEGQVQHQARGGNERERNRGDRRPGNRPPPNGGKRPRLPR